MANWSTDTYYFGRLFNQQEAEQRLAEYAASTRLPASSFATIRLDDSYDYMSERQDIIIPALRFQRAIGPAAYIVDQITLFANCVVQVSGFGRWGTPITLTDESWQVLNQGVVIYEGHDGSSDEYSRRITIAGEVVLDEAQPMFPEDDTPEALARYEAQEFSKFEGRTPEEQHFFRAFWTGYAKRKAVRHED